jgi:hypothetical protein
MRARAGGGRRRELTGCERQKDERVGPEHVAICEAHGDDGGESAKKKERKKKKKRLS